MGNKIQMMVFKWININCQTLGQSDECPNIVWILQFKLNNTMHATCHCYSTYHCQHTDELTLMYCHVLQGREHLLL